MWQVVTDWRFRRTDEAKELWPRLYTLLERGVEELSAPRLSALAEWLRQVGYQPDQETKGWESVMKRVFARWEQSKDAEARDLLGGLVHAEAHELLHPHRGEGEGSPGSWESAAFFRPAKLQDHLKKGVRKAGGAA